MSVAHQLGFDDPGNELLELARTRWPEWQRQHQDLLFADTLDEMPRARHAVDRERLNRAMLALGWLGCPTGGNEAAATAVLVWLLSPGAAGISQRLLRDEPTLVGVDADQLVAGQLWIESRSFKEAHFSRRNHAVSVLRDTERSIRRELAIHSRSDRVWLGISLKNPHDLAESDSIGYRQVGVVDPDAEEVDALLTTALRDGAVTTADVDLLLEVARVGYELDQRRGLCPGAVSDHVARRRGIAPRTVSRRAHGAVAAIRTAHARSLERSA